MVTRDGTGRAVLDDESVTKVASATLPLTVTVQMVLVVESTKAGEQVTPVKASAGETDTVAVLVMPLSVAETVTEESTETDPAVAVKLADDDPAAIVIE